MRKVWLFKNTDFNELNYQTMEFQWEQFLHKCSDVDEMFNRLTHIYLEMDGRSILSKLVRIRLRDKRWFNSEIRKEMSKIFLNGPKMSKIFLNGQKMSKISLSLSLYR
jgi:hypothetical protein